MKEELRDKIESRQTSENLLRNRMTTKLWENSGKLTILRRERYALEQILDREGISYENSIEWQYYKNEIIKIREFSMVLQELLK